MNETYAPDRGNLLDFQIEPTTPRAPSDGATSTSTDLPMKSSLRGVDPMDRPVGPDDHGARCAEHGILMGGIIF